MTRIDGRKLFHKGHKQFERFDFPDSGVLHLGIDIGSVSCKLALLDENKQVRYLRYQRTQGRPMETALAMLTDLVGETPSDRIASLAGTGSAGRALCGLLGIDFINELICQAAAIRHLRRDVRTLVEMGGQDSKVIFLSDPDDAVHGTGGEMANFSVNAVCAAGTGSFLDQQASRLGIHIENEFGQMALRSETPPRVAGRCSVFAKSDMIHLQQQATPVHDIVAGLCLGLARNLKSSLCQGKDVIKPVAFCGGVAGNVGVVWALEEVFELGRGGLIVPEEHALTGAIGAGLVQMRQRTGEGSRQELRVLLGKLEVHLRKNQSVGYRQEPLKRPTHEAPPSRVHDEIVTEARRAGRKIPSYLGVDVGSISTNVVIMDERQRVLSKAYLMTASRPLEAVRQGLDIVGREVADIVEILGVATTGSGRYLTGDFVGADLVINEITAQATGAAIVDPTVDTIFEIGGQDSKYISLEDGVVVDFEMNHACAAGTGSFLEEQAERLALNIKGEFASEAFASESPVRLGERCTVFMESDLVGYQQQGVQRRDLVAGLSYSIVTNYLNRVVGHRKIGQKVFFQGGTAFNRAVVSAFEAVTGKPIIVPDHHEVTGALGAAELARRHMANKAAEAHLSEPMRSTFRGFDLAKMEYQIKTFECTHCPNNCEIKEVLLAGSVPLYYGSRCDRYNLKKDRSEERAIPDLFRQRQEMLEHYAGLDRKEPSEPAGIKKTVGIPMCLSNYQLLPLWGTLFKELGFEVVLSGRSTRNVIQAGVETVVAQPCFPVKVAHGHVLELMRRGVDYIWLPSVVSMNRDYPENKHNQLCPYVQTIPYQVQSALKAKGIDYRGDKNRLLAPHIRFQDGTRMLRRTLAPLSRELGVGRGRIHRALNAAMAAQKEFDRACVERGREVLAELAPDQKACVIVSRPYNGCDPGVSLDLPRKLRQMNVLAIPMDWLDLADSPITEPELQKEMYWKYGQRILRAAHIIRRDPRLSAIYMSNFSCGPDSFIISFFKELMTTAGADGRESHKPALILEIDEHSADAGVITRLEAFHESLKSSEHQKRNQKSKIKDQKEEKLKTKSLNLKEDQEKSDVGDGQELVASSPWRQEWGDCSGRTVYIPWMNDHSYALAAAFRHCGQSAEVMSHGDDQTLRWGRKYTSGKECLPCIITTGDMLKIINTKGFEADKAAFFMPSGSGPCRFGQYNCLQRLIIKQSGLPTTIPIVAPNQDSNFYTHFKRFRKDPTRLAYCGIAAVDLLFKAMLKIRPYERRVGEAEKAYQRCMARVTKATEGGISDAALEREMESCAAELAGVDQDRTEPRPRVTMVGEIYVRSHRFANDDVILKLESLGAEVSMSSFVEWLYYTNYTRQLMALRNRDYRLYLQNLVKMKVQQSVERRLARPLEVIFGPLADGDVREVIAWARPYMHESFEGEAVLSLGKIVEMYHHGVSGAVNVMPFTCMPSTIVSSITPLLSADCGGMPIINISYDGQQDPTLQTRLEAFVHQVSHFNRQEAKTASATQKS